jgi:O-acetyl-ADP-ribose deacetylase (regulator of RNase III)
LHLFILNRALALLLSWFKNSLGQIEFVIGDITEQDTEAIVNAANNRLIGGGGVDGAIHRKAGKKLLSSYLLKIGHCATGDAVVSPGFKLKAKWIIHTVGPIWRGGKADEGRLLASCYKRCLEIADDMKLSSIAFCAISTGVYGFPVDLAAKIALRTVRDTPSSLDLIRFVSFDEPTHLVYEDAQKSIFS